MINKKNNVTLFEKFLCQKYLNMNLLENFANRLTDYQVCKIISLSWCLVDNYKMVAVKIINQVGSRPYRKRCSSNDKDLRFADCLSSPCHNIVIQIFTLNYPTRLKSDGDSTGWRTQNPDSPATGILVWLYSFSSEESRQQVYISVRVRISPSVHIPAASYYWYVQEVFSKKNFSW